jgi:hypothetical protein
MIFCNKPRINTVSYIHSVTSLNSLTLKQKLKYDRWSYCNTSQYYFLKLPSYISSKDVW